jgi:type VI secretion system protein ImpM
VSGDPPLDRPELDIPGWYGKLPGLGDFASRRLPSSFVQPWDAWLQEGLAAARVALPEAWLDIYLTMPIWRFVLLPGLVGPSGWAGVLMPSVDRVGRQFPLTLALGLPSDAAAAHAVLDGSGWFEELESAALSALDVTREAEHLDHALAACALAPPSGLEAGGPTGAMRRLPPGVPFAAVARTEALRGWAEHQGWRSLWWTRGRVDDQPLMLAAAGLPAAEEFTWMLQSRSPVAAAATATPDPDDTANYPDAPSPGP